MKKKICVLLLIFMMAILPCSSHPGRTDSNGGHRDNKNKSGLGSYHYHCGGYPAHLHRNGVCPYKSTPAPIAAEAQTSSASAPTVAETKSESAVSNLLTPELKRQIIISIKMLTN